MRHFTLFISLVVLLGAAAVSLRASAAVDTGVSAAGAGLFSSSAELYGVVVRESTLASGVIIATDGTAVGEFQTVLSGSSLTGPQDISIEGVVTTGAVNLDGGVTFGGMSTVDTGAGLLSGVPFSVTLNASGLQLLLGTTQLPAQALTEGGIRIR